MKKRQGNINNEMSIINTLPIYNTFSQMLDEYGHLMEAARFRQNKSWKKYKPTEIRHKNSQSSQEIHLPEIHSQVYHNSNLHPKRNIYRHQESLSTYNISTFSPKHLKNRGASLNKYLSSKVDFFNDKNQHRLQIKKRKKLMDLGYIQNKKQGIPRSRSVSERKESANSLLNLLNSYLFKRSQFQNESNNYYVIGKDAGNDSYDFF